LPLCCGQLLGTLAAVGLILAHPVPQRFGVDAKRSRAMWANGRSDSRASRKARSRSSWGTSSGLPSMRPLPTRIIPWFRSLHQTRSGSPRISPRSYAKDALRLVAGGVGTETPEGRSNTILRSTLVLSSVTWWDRGHVPAVHAAEEQRRQHGAVRGAGPQLPYRRAEQAAGAAQPGPG